MSIENQLKQIAGSVQAAPQDERKDSEAIARLAADLEAEKDTRKEERFMWILALFIVLDIYIFSQMSTWAGPVCISIFQLFLVIVLGRTHGVQDISMFVDNFLKSDIVSRK